MSHLDKRRHLLALSAQIARKESLSDEQLTVLALVCFRIGNGENANKVLSVTPQKGRSYADAIARIKLSFILHWIKGAITPMDSDPPGLGLTIEAACEQAWEKIVPAANTIYGNPSGAEYSPEYLKKCWFQADKKHMQNAGRNFYDDDNPY